MVMSILHIALAIATVGVVSVLSWIIYVLLFHPLAKYPGPTLGKITVLYSAYHSWKGDIHLDIWRCHQRYGDCIRYRPNALIFNTAKALEDIYRRPVGFSKSKGYSPMVHRAPNTFTILGGRDHARRRRLLAQGLSEKAIRDYEPRIKQHVSKFCDILGAGASEHIWSEPRDMASLCNYLSFDIMSDVVFGAKYDLLGSERFRYVCKAIEQSNVRMTFLVHAGQWASLVDKLLFQKAIIARNRFIRFVSRVVEDRLARPPTWTGEGDMFLDVFARIQEAKDPLTGNVFSGQEIGAESTTLIVAGSDTTSTSICTVLFYLAHNSAIYARVAEEVRRHFKRHNEVDNGALLAPCVYLRACIDEAHRMSPAVGNTLLREVVNEGTLIDNHYVPSGCDVGVGIYSIHHSSNYFSDPFVYRPERWLIGEPGTTPETVNRGLSILHPFSLGPRSCLGRALASTELQLIIASILCAYDFKLANGELASIGEGDPNWEYGRHRSNEYQLYDHITSQKNGPFLRFRPRISTKINTN